MQFSKPAKRPRVSHGVRRSVVSAVAREYFVAREYLRVSFDRTGEERSNEEQHADNEERAEEYGWQLSDRFYDDVGSASPYSDKERDGFNELIADLEDDQFNAEILMLWEASRGSRRVREWLDMIDLCELRGVVIYVYNHDRVYDPSNARDRADLIDAANKAEYSSAETSERTQRTARRQARKGRPHGQVNLGYMRLYNPHTGRLTEQVRDPEKAPLIEELFKRLDEGGDGNSCRRIARDWKERGIRNGRGTPYAPSHLRTLAITPAYAGLRVHNPGNKSGARIITSETVYEATWEALVDVEVFWRVYRKLTDPSRRTYVSGRVRHLCSEIVPCDVCGGPLAAFDRAHWVTPKDRTPEAKAAAKAEMASRPRIPQYKCKVKGCVMLGRAELDEVVETAVLAYLSVPENVERLTAVSSDGRKVAAARAEAERVRAELLTLGQQVGAGRMSPELAAVAEPGIRERLARAERALADVSTPGALQGILKPGEDIALRWTRASITTKREILRIVLRPNALGQLRVKRKPKGGRHYCHAKDRVVWLVDGPDTAAGTSDES